MTRNIARYLYDSRVSCLTNRTLLETEAIHWRCIGAIRQVFSSIRLTAVELFDVESP